MKFKTELLAVNAFIKAMPSNWHIQKIETNITSGVPDLNIAVSHRTEFWVEVKNGPTPELRPFQIAWWLRRIRAGGNIWLLWFHNGDFRLYQINRKQFDILEKMEKPNINLLAMHAKGNTWDFLKNNIIDHNT